MVRDCGRMGKEYIRLVLVPTRKKLSGLQQNGKHVQRSMNVKGLKKNDRNNQQLIVEARNDQANKLYQWIKKESCTCLLKSFPSLNYKCMVVLCPFMITNHLVYLCYSISCF